MMKSPVERSAWYARRCPARRLFCAATMFAWLINCTVSLAGAPVDQGVPDASDSSASGKMTDRQLAPTPLLRESPDVRTDATAGDDHLERGPRRSGLASVVRRDVGGQRSSPFELGTGPWYRSGLVSIIVVLALVWLVYKIVRKWVPGGKVSDGGALAVVARTTLTPKQHVALIRLGRRFVMVGVSPDRMDRLCVIDNADEASELIVRIDGRNAGRADGFEMELAREMDDYALTHEDESGRNTPSDSSSKMPRPPLQELLTRLRTLQRD